MTINDIRKAIRPLGYKLKLQTFSWGVHASWTSAAGDSLPSIFTPDTLAFWRPLLDWRQTNRDALKALSIPGLAS